MLLTTEIQGSGSEPVARTPQRAVCIAESSRSLPLADKECVGLPAHSCSGPVHFRDSLFYLRLRNLVLG